MPLGKSYGEARLEAACARALALGTASYRSIESILKQGLDRSPTGTCGHPRARDTRECAWRGLLPLTVTFPCHDALTGDEESHMLTHPTWRNSSSCA